MIDQSVDANKKQYAEPKQSENTVRWQLNGGIHLNLF